MTTQQDTDLIREAKRELLALSAEDAEAWRIAVVVAAYAPTTGVTVINSRAILAVDALLRQRVKPLTDEQILDIADDYKSQYLHGGTTFDEFDYDGFARAVEAAHGIGAQTCTTES